MSLQCDSGVAKLSMKGIKIRSIEPQKLQEKTGDGFFVLYDLPKKCYMISVFISGQTYGPVIDSLCSAVLLSDTLFTSVDSLLLLTRTHPFPVEYTVIVLGAITPPVTWKGM